MSEQYQQQPFCFSLHGLPQGGTHSFYYGIDRVELIRILEAVVADYKKTEEESKGYTLQLKVPDGK